MGGFYDPETASFYLLATLWDSPSDASEFAAALPRREDLRWRVAGDLRAGSARRLLGRMVAGPGG